ncbi:hypothetical protein ACFQNE_07215 [Gordonia phosphorivorans]|uniref:Uncharacterized protein n=1 Tax=Gordonia phosphorivorans TaxID=1056982 RepID=A0ABV6H4A4_9ACTN
MTSQDLLSLMQHQLAWIARKWERGGITRDEVVDLIVELGKDIGEDFDEFDEGGDPVGCMAAVVPVGEDENLSCGLDREAVLGLSLGCAIMRANTDQVRDDLLRSAFGRRVIALDPQRRIGVIDLLATSLAASVLGDDITAHVVDEYADTVSREALQHCCQRQVHVAAYGGDVDRAWACLRLAPDPLSIARTLVEADRDRGAVGPAADFYRWSLAQEVNAPPAAEQIVYLIMIGDEDRALAVLDEAIVDPRRRDPDYDWLLALAAEVLGEPKIARELAAQSTDPTSAELWLLAQDESDVLRRLDLL